MTVSPRRDPIGDRYFKPLRQADDALKALFIGGVIFSFAAILVDKNTALILYDGVQIVFFLLVAAFFAIGLAIKLYWSPRAAEQRRLDFLTNSSGVALTHERTMGYYNNDEVDAVRRLGVSLLENTFFSKSIALAMAWTERAVIAIYVVVFFAVILVRGVDLAIAATAAQAIFSEQILSRWLRLEWLRVQCDSSYKSLYALFQSDPSPDVLSARVLEAFASYETAKANAGIVLSSRLFAKRNPMLSVEWEEIKSALKLAQTRH